MDRYNIQQSSKMCLIFCLYIKDFSTEVLFVYFDMGIKDMFRTTGPLKFSWGTLVYSPLKDAKLFTLLLGAGIIFSRA